MKEIRGQDWHIIKNRVPNKIIQYHRTSFTYSLKPGVASTERFVASFQKKFRHIFFFFERMKVRFFLPLKFVGANFHQKLFEKHRCVCVCVCVHLCVCVGACVCV